MRRATLVAYYTLWIATGAGVLLHAAGWDLLPTSAPHDALAASAGTALSLARHNAVVALWPLALVALGWPTLPVAGRVGDLLVSGQLFAHGLIVGNAIGQRPELWRYLPQLPVEWLALALPTGAWMAATHDPPDRRTLARVAALTIAAILLAAALETYAVPLP